jgi:hypothetical protein
LFDLGSLASSLDFLYTDKWAQVYSIQRISNNKVIVDEVSMLQDGMFTLHPASRSRLVTPSSMISLPTRNVRFCGMTVNEPMKVADVESSSSDQDL